MTCTEQEFRHNLDKLALIVTPSPGGLTVHAAGTTIRFHLTPGPTRKIALLQLPTLHVRIAGEGPLSPAEAQLIERIDRGMLRGGG